VTHDGAVGPAARRIAGRPEPGAGDADPPPPRRYVGRFAPSPTGPLHAGSLVAALASWLDARAHGGRWLVRIEDVDGPRCVPGADALILDQLARCGLVPDEAPVWQSQRGAAYRAALDVLVAAGHAYPCGCSRRQIAEAATRAGMPPVRHGELVYPGTCRSGLHGASPRAWRLRTDDAVIDWHDRRLGALRQDVEHAVGDFVLARADGSWAYQLAVVVDDAAQDITDVVRGADLADNTPRQIHLQRRLGLPRPTYLHTPLVLGADGAKLSKQNGARGLDLTDPLAALRQAAGVLDIRVEADTPAGWLAAATLAWRDRWRR
jgi:glutamyl-Q tRNA(Asp) synthetase